MKEEYLTYFQAIPVYQQTIQQAHFLQVHMRLVKIVSVLPDHSAYILSELLLQLHKQMHLPDR